MGNEKDWPSLDIAAPPLVLEVSADTLELSGTDPSPDQHLTVIENLSNGEVLVTTVERARWT